jgi:hypothetical protein
VYFVVWAGGFISGGIWNSLDLLKFVNSSVYVSMLDEIQGWEDGRGAVTSMSKITTALASWTARTSITSTTLRNTPSSRSPTANSSATGVAQQ